MATICRTCGATLSEFERECPYCGNRVIPSETAQNAGSSPQVAESRNTAPQYQQPQYQQQLAQQPQQYLPYQQPYQPQNYQPQQPYRPQVKNNKDAASHGLNVLSIFFPLIGWILFLSLRHSHPRKAKFCNIWAWIGVGIWAVFSLYIGLIIDSL